MLISLCIESSHFYEGATGKGTVCSYTSKGQDVNEDYNYNINMGLQYSIVWTIL